SLGWAVIPTRAWAQTRAPLSAEPGMRESVGPSPERPGGRAGGSFLVPVVGVHPHRGGAGVPAGPRGVRGGAVRPSPGARPRADPRPARALGPVGHRVLLVVPGSPGGRAGRGDVGPLVERGVAVDRARRALRDDAADVLPGQAVLRADPSAH